MIGRLRGEVIERAATTLVVDVHGVGYVVTVTPQSPFRVGEQVDLHVHTQVREDAISLYGFADPLEREVFDLLIGVPNIGPAKAMGILQTPAASIIQMVAQREPGKLAKLPGVGKKTAERLLVDLVDKMASLGPAAAGVRLPVGTSPALERPAGVQGDLVSALVNLGFKEDAALAAASGAVERLSEDAGLEALLREALSKRG
ncbi:MAG: Holliday junction branch migration protein RuvA [Myxococcales bacterium]|nr:Holliday junction branch migration protein RuvA [Myxococcales bacterium]